MNENLFLLSGYTFIIEKILIGNLCVNMNYYDAIINNVETEFGQNPI